MPVELTGPQALDYFEVADTLSDAISMARSFVGPGAEISMLHQPPILITDVM